MKFKFNINSLEEKLNKIDDSSKKITKKMGNFTNKKQIEYAELKTEDSTTVLGSIGSLALGSIGSLFFVFGSIGRTG